MKIPIAARSIVNLFKSYTMSSVIDPRYREIVVEPNSHHVLTLTKIYQGEQENNKGFSSEVHVSITPINDPLVFLMINFVEINEKLCVFYAIKKVGDLRVSVFAYDIERRITTCFEIPKNVCTYTFKTFFPIEDKIHFSIGDDDFLCRIVDDFLLAGSPSQISTPISPVFHKLKTEERFAVGKDNGARIYKDQFNNIVVRNLEKILYSAHVDTLEHISLSLKWVFFVDKGGKYARAVLC